jgi:hypothetical protein
LSNVKAGKDGQKLHRNEIGGIELDLTHAKTSELQDGKDDDNDDADRELTEEEQK